MLTAIWFRLHESPQQRDVIIQQHHGGSRFTLKESCLNLYSSILEERSQYWQVRQIQAKLVYQLIDDLGEKPNHTHTHTQKLNTSIRNPSLRLGLLPWQQHPGLFRQTNISLHAFKHTHSWIFWSGPNQWTVRTLLRGHPGGHRGANQVLTWGSPVIMMQGHSSHYNPLRRDSMTRATAWLLIPYSFLLFMPWSLVSKEKKYHNVGKCSQAGIKMKWVTPGNDFFSFFSLHKWFQSTSFNSIRTKDQWGVTNESMNQFFNIFLSIDSDPTSNELFTVSFI